MQRASSFFKSARSISDKNGSRRPFLSRLRSRELITRFWPFFSWSYFTELFSRSRSAKLRRNFITPTDISPHFRFHRLAHLQARILIGIIIRDMPFYPETKLRAGNGQEASLARNKLDISVNKRVSHWNIAPVYFHVGKLLSTTVLAARETSHGSASPFPIVFHKRRKTALTRGELWLGSSNFLFI